MSTVESMKKGLESKKRKTSSRISSRDLAAPAEDEIEAVISPKKRNKIAMKMLRTSTMTDGNYRIGSILTLPELQDGIVRKGEVKGVKIICTVTDNRIGRTSSSEEERSGNRFVYLADCTGYLSLGVNATEAGIRKHGIASDQCEENTRSFFNAIVTGTVEWIPSRGNREHPTFFLNKGSIEKIELDGWSGDTRFMLPTTDVCKQMIKSKYGGTALFSTTGICGRVDVICENQSGVLVISLEDPVGYSALEIHPVRDDETAKSIMKDNDIAEGSYLFLKGRIEVCNFPHHENAVLKMASTNGSLFAVSSPVYLDYVKKLQGIASSLFAGIVPEDM